jgi:DNA (cytosine-5)-methyltransferase 1
MRFIDLFAGLGGFHLALSELGHECVYACEINESLANLYEENFGIRPDRDIRKIKIENIPKFDILCAGFPCQPFSKAGKQKGMTDKDQGTLIDEIIKIIAFHRPKYLILENVPSIRQNDNEATWNYLVNKLENKLQYYIDHRDYSPHEFGIPQHRKRIFIVGSKFRLNHFQFPEPTYQTADARKIILQKPLNSRYIGEGEKRCLSLWQEFLDCVPLETKLPSFPIWAMEFGATYPFDERFPHKMTQRQLSHFKGNFGKSLSKMSKEEQLLELPSYARVKNEFPSWKKRYIKYNREFYATNRKYIKKSIEKISKYTSQSWQKLEWNVQNGSRNIYSYLLQFRPSGIRVKKSDFFPSLVCSSTQIPIIGWEQRYLTKEEGAVIQSIDIGKIKLPTTDSAAFEALGNAVNTYIVKIIAKELIKVHDTLRINGNVLHELSQKVSLIYEEQ